tara:strand:+ start:324 stop:857 length:534 start_codon:yes stop_codon:yes gene_type:complete
MLSDRENTVFLAVTENVLSLSARKYAIDYFEENKKYLEVNYNVMKTWQAVVENFEDDILLEMLNNIKSVCEKVTNRKYKTNSAKFIDYVKDSYCKGHADNPEASHLSVIVMIDISDDLIGGEAYFAKDRAATTTHKMIAGPLSSGDCLMYGYNVHHGVEKVFSGRRLVLVLWLIEED